MLKNKHFCLLGGGGFIGTRLASQLLKEGFKVTSIDNSEESIFWSKLQFEKYKSNFFAIRSNFLLGGIVSIYSYD